VRRWDGLLQ